MRTLWLAVLALLVSVVPAVSFLSPAILSGDEESSGPIPGLAIYLPLESDFADQANSNDGTPGGTANFGTASWGPALTCNGSDTIVNIAPDPTFDNADEYTVTACVRLNSYGEGGIGRVFDWENDSAISTVRYFLSQTDTAQRLNDARYGTEGQWEGPANSILTGQTYHLGMTFSKTTDTAEFFIDGQPVTTSVLQAPGGGFNPNTGQLSLCNRTAQDRTFDGDFGHFRFFTRVLSQPEMQALADSDCAPQTAPQLVLHAPLEGTYTDLAHGNDGVPGGSPAFGTASWGTALNCDGANDIVTFASAPEFADLTQYTATMCVNLNSYGENNLGRMFDWNNNLGQSTTRFFTNGINNALQLNEGRWATEGQWRSPDNSLLTGTTYGVAVTHNGTTGSTQFYLDGVPVTASVLQAPGGIFSPATGNLHVCNRVDTARTLHGFFGQFRLYDQVLPEATIAALASADCAPVGGLTQWFALPSSLVTPIPANQPIDPDSANIINYIKNSQGDSFVWNTTNFAPTMWDADALAHNVIDWVCTACNPNIPVEWRQNVPTPIIAVPPGGQDGHVTIYNSVYVWEFFAAQKISDTEWTALTMTRYERSGSGQRTGGAPPFFGAVQGCYNTTMTEGVITKEEFDAAAAGDRNAIKHAIHLVVFDLKEVDGGFERRDPCQGFVNGNDPLSPLVYGMRIRLKSSINVEALPLTDAEKAILIAAQTYGFLYSDSNCSTCFPDIRFESQIGKPWSFPSFSANWPSVSWDDFEVVTPITWP